MNGMAMKNVGQEQLTSKPYSGLVGIIVTGGSYVDGFNNNLVTM